MKKQSILIIAILLMVAFLFGCATTDTSVQEPVKKALTNMKDVTYVQYKNAESTVTLVKADDMWSCEEQAELSLVHAFVEDRMKVLSHIEGTVVADAKKAECGLEEPAYTLTVKNAEKTVTLFVGMNEDFELYAMVDGEDTIYSIDDEVVEVLSMEATSFSQPTDDVYSYIMDTEEDVLMEEDYVEEEDMSYEDVVEEQPEEDLSDENLVEEPTDTPADTEE